MVVFLILSGVWFFLSFLIQMRLHVHVCRVRRQDVPLCSQSYKKRRDVKPEFFDTMQEVKECGRSFCDQCFNSLQGFQQDRYHTCQHFCAHVLGRGLQDAIRLALEDYQITVLEEDDV